MTTVIDRDKAIELLQAQVAKRGADYVYEKVESSNGFEGCINWVKSNVTGEREPSCIVGHVFFDLGYIDFIDQGGSAYYAADTVENRTDLEFTQDAINVLSVAQQDQDAGVPWGLAVQNAIAFNEEEEE